MTPADETSESNLPAEETAESEPVDEPAASEDAVADEEPAAAQ